MEENITEINLICVFYYRVFILYIYNFSNLLENIIIEVMCSPK